MAAATRVQRNFSPIDSGFFICQTETETEKKTSAGRGKVLMSPTRAQAALRCQRFLFASTTGHSAYVQFFTYVACNDNSSHVAARMCRRLVLHLAT